MSLGSVISKYGFDNEGTGYLLIDVSGGRDLKRLKIQIDSLAELAEHKFNRLYLITFDDRVTASAILTPGDIGLAIMLDLAGGGGTDPRVALNMVRNLHSQWSSKAIVYFYSDMLFSLPQIDYDTCEINWIVDSENVGNLHAEMKGRHIVI